MKDITNTPIETLHLYPLVDAKLVELLKSLSEEEWKKPTVCKLWDVKDIAAHILDGCYLRRLSIARDGYYGERPGLINSYGDLVNFLNQLNADWVKASKRLSPAVILSLIEEKSEEVVDYFKSLDPYGEALFSVAWAGEEKSQNWFDIARDYTERWLHQQQIRLAVGKEGIMTRELYYPLLTILMKALPVTYKNVEAENGTVLKFSVSSEAGGVWYLLRSENRWMLVERPSAAPASEVTIPAAIAWRIFSKGIDRSDAQRSVTVHGDRKLGEVILTMTAVMA